MEGNPIPYTSTISNNGFMGILAVEVPLFHWGEGIKKVRKAKLEVENARLTLDRNRRLMELEARQAFSNLEIGMELIESAKTAMSEARTQLRINQIDYLRAIGELD